MRWLVTGGCGFVGTALIRRLVREGGQYIRVLDNLSVGSRADLARACDFSEGGKGAGRNPGGPHSAAGADPSGPLSRCHLRVGDIREPGTCRLAAEDVDVVVHLAANTGVPASVEAPRRDMTANVIGTVNLLEAARQNGVRRFVFASSGAPVGECVPPVHEEMPCRPVSPYGASKLAGEAYCSAYFRSYGLETVALRFGNVYGPGSSHKSSVVARFINRALTGESLEVYGDGRQTRDFIFIDDLVKAILASIRTPGIGGEIFQIATNRETTVNELVSLLVPALEAAGIERVQAAHGSERPGDVKRNFSDTAKARKVLGWEAEVGLVEGLARTVEWFVAEQQKPSGFCAEAGGAIPNSNRKVRELSV